MKKFLICLLLPFVCFGLNGCNTVRGVVTGTGTDNTPPPSNLTKCVSQERMRANWLTSAGCSMGSDTLKLGPTVTDNIVFTADAKGAVVATNPRNGKRVWSTNLRVPITSGPTTNDGLVAVGTSDGEVFALRETNGSQLWHANVSSSIFAAPQISQGRVIVKTLDGKLIAFDGQSGQQLWVYDHGAPTMVMRKDNTPQIYGDKIITGFADGKVAAFSLSQGRLLWEQTIAISQGASQTQQMTDILADPIIDRGIVYIATAQGNLAALGANRGNIIWQQDDKDGLSYNSIALGNGLLFAVNSRDQIKAFNRSNGELVWQDNRLAYRRLSPVQVIDNTVGVGDYAGYIHFFSQQDGQYIAQNLVENGVRISAISAPLNNYFFIAGANGNLSAWRVG